MGQRGNSTPTHLCSESSNSRLGKGGPNVLMIIASACIPLYLLVYVLSKMWRSARQKCYQVFVCITCSLVATLLLFLFYTL